MSKSFQSSSLARATIYYNVSVLTDWRNCILLYPRFVLADYDLMWRIENV